MIHQSLFETDTQYGHYEVWDTIYAGRSARVLYSGHRQTAQSGLAQDDNPHLLFDYNQRLLELAGALRPARLLLIGGGVYTLPLALLDALDTVHIDVVEIDEGLDMLATRFFGLRANPRLRIIHADGWQYIAQNHSPYDMIVLDAFLQATTPHELTSLEAVEAYRRSLAPQGVFARNVISAYYGETATSLHEQSQYYRTVFGNVAIFPASNAVPLAIAQNLLLTAQTGEPRSLDAYLRYPALPEGMSL